MRPSPQGAAAAVPTRRKTAGRSSAPNGSSFSWAARPSNPKRAKFTLTFLAEENRIAGVGACNRIMGKYEATEKGALKIGPLASTMMACPGMEQEDAFTKALESTTHYDMDGPMLLLLSDGELRAVFQAKP